jgi:Ca-activated chloride channel family protein
MKASRAALLAGQLCVAALLSRTVPAAGAAGVWSDLWRTPDQQGQTLLDAGQPAQAAARFHDPRRRAYADLEAGRYDAAAKQLAPLNDAQSEYNRGNALARSGNLQAALTAYDAALKQAPADRDIRHNRDLVARALQQQRQSPQSSAPKGGGQGRQQPQSQQGGSGSRQSGNGSQSSGSQTAANGSQAGTKRPGNSAQQHAAGNGANPSREAPGQAQRDAAQAAAIARAQRERGATGNKAQGQAAQRDGLLAGGAKTPKQQPETERQLALDQWLRQIPDSAAGLLQRKFLIEHMMRQQDGGQ